MNLNANREHLLRCLREIPELAEEARATRGTNPVSSDGARGRRVPGSVVLADLDRIMAGDRANDHSGIGVLSTWVRAIEDELDEEGTPYAPAEGNVAACCAWLAAHVGWLEANWRKVGMTKPLPMFIAPDHPDGLPADIHRLWATLRGICRIRDKAPVPCPDCGYPLTEVGDMMRCPFGHEHPGAYRLAADLIRRPSIPTDDICAEFGVERQQLYDWQARRKLCPDKSKGARPLHWWPRDVVALLRPDVAEVLKGAA